MLLVPQMDSPDCRFAVLEKLDSISGHLKVPTEPVQGDMSKLVPMPRTHIREEAVLES